MTDKGNIHLTCSGGQHFLRSAPNGIEAFPTIIHRWMGARIEPQVLGAASVCPGTAPWMCGAAIGRRALSDKHLQDAEERGALWTTRLPLPLPALNKCAVCGAKGLQNYFLKTTLEPKGINEDVPAISSTGVHASASPIINTNCLYRSCSAAPRGLHPAGPTPCTQTGEHGVWAQCPSVGTGCGGRWHGQHWAAAELLAFGPSGMAFVYFKTLHRALNSVPLKEKNTAISTGYAD